MNNYNTRTLLKTIALNTFLLLPNQINSMLPETSTNDTALTQQESNTPLAQELSEQKKLIESLQKKEISYLHTIKELTQEIEFLKKASDHRFEY